MRLTYGQSTDSFTAVDLLKAAGVVATIA